MAVCWCWIVWEAISLPPASNLINTTVERPVRVILSERSESNAERDTQWRDLGRVYLSHRRSCASHTPSGFDFGLRPSLRMTRGERSSAQCSYKSVGVDVLDDPLSIKSYVVINQQHLYRVSKRLPCVKGGYLLDYRQIIFRATM